MSDAPRSAAQVCALSNLCELTLLKGAIQKYDQLPDSWMELLWANPTTRAQFTERVCAQPQPLQLDDGSVVQFIVGDRDDEIGDVSVSYVALAQLPPWLRLLCTAFHLNDIDSHGPRGTRDMNIYIDREDDMDDDEQARCNVGFYWVSVVCTPNTWHSGVKTASAFAHNNMDLVREFYQALAMPAPNTVQAMLETLHNLPHMPSQLETRIYELADAFFTTSWWKRIHRASVPKLSNGYMRTPFMTVYMHDEQLAAPSDAESEEF